MTEAFAAMTPDGKILVSTVSGTMRAAMVNWLYAEAKVMVYDTYSDERINEMFMHESGRGSIVRIRRVSIEVTG